MNDLSLAGKVAVVTGGSKGIGKAIALAMAENGAKVVIAARDVRTASEVADHIIAKGGAASAARLDITDPISCGELMTATVASHGSIDILVCNAAANQLAAALETPFDSWTKTIATELSGYFYCAQAAAKAMVQQKGGSIVMVSANSSVVGYSDIVGTATAKGGVDQLVRNLAVEWGAHNIRVNSINPGFTEHVPPDGADVAPAEGDLEEWINASTPLARRARLEELAVPAVFLASDASSFITGQNLIIDGGYSVR